MGKAKKKYKSIVLISVIIVSAILYSVALFLLIRGDECTRIIADKSLLPITVGITVAIIKLIIESNSFIDVKLCNHRYLQSRKVIDVWATSKIDQSKLVDCTFAMISNIGETIVTLLKVIINDDERNQSYTIEYALKKNDTIYLAIPKNVDDIKSLTVTDYAGRDTTRNFYGELTKVGDVYIFSIIDDLKKNKQPVPKPCYRLGLQGSNHSCD